MAYGVCFTCILLIVVTLFISLIYSVHNVHERTHIQMITWENTGKDLGLMVMFFSSGWWNIPTRVYKRRWGDLCIEDAFL